MFALIALFLVMPTDGFSWPFWHHDEPVSKEKVTEVHSVVDEPLVTDEPKKNPEVIVDPRLKDAQLEDPTVYRDYHITACDSAECEERRARQGWSLMGMLRDWAQSLFGPILGMKAKVEHVKEKVADKIDDLEGLLHDKGKEAREKLKDEFRAKHHHKHEHDSHKKLHEMKDKADDTFRGTVENVKETIEGVKDNIVEMKDKVMGVKDKVVGAKDTVEGKMNDAKASIGRAADAVKDKVEHNFVMDTVKNLMGSATEMVGEKVEETGKKIEETGKKMKTN
jgi:ElaB/YqjD/DUF883 family membrane-anchored ribosome-binding protein